MDPHPGADQSLERLLAEAERLCGIDAKRPRAAAAA
jgi:hypothetical protein